MNREDYLLLNEATTLWGAVQRENFQDRQLVTEAEWNEWRQYDSAVSIELNAIIDRFVNELSAVDRRYLENLQQRVGEAKRMSSEELEARSAGAHSALRAKLRGNLLPQ